MCVCVWGGGGGGGGAILYYIPGEPEEPILQFQIPLKPYRFLRAEAQESGYQDARTVTHTSLEH